MAGTVEQLLLSNGQTECEIIQDTVEHAGNWRLIHTMAQTTVDILVNTQLKTGTYVGLTIPAGAVLGGKFTNIKLATGKVIAYT